MDEIVGALERDMRVELRGLGALSVRQKREWQERNPFAHEPVPFDGLRRNGVGSQSPDSIAHVRKVRHGRELPATDESFDH